MNYRLFRPLQFFDHTGSSYRLGAVAVADERRIEHPVQRIPASKTTAQTMAAATNFERMSALPG
jgi:hypothetical protein